MNDSLATNLQRALRFTFKSGSLVYILITAVIFCLICTDNLEYALKHHVPRDPLSPGGTALILQTIALLLLLYKLLDNSERMRLGLDDEPVSFAPVSVISGTLPLRLTGLGLLVMIALGFVAAALAFMQSRTGLQLLGGLVLLAGFILNPAITLAMLKTDTASAAFSPRQWGDAISDIGAGRYFALLGIAVALIAVAILFIVFLIAPAMQQNLVAGVMQQAKSGKSTISVPGTMYIYYLLIGLVLMTLAFFNQHLYASAFPREDSDDPESFSYGMNTAEMESISAALAGHGVTPPAAEDKSAGGSRSGSRFQPAGRRRHQRHGHRHAKSLRPRPCPRRCAARQQQNRCRPRPARAVCRRGARCRRLLPRLASHLRAQAGI